MFTGFFISVLGIPPFIVTLATMLMGRGLTYVALQAQTKGSLPVNYTKIGAGYLPTIAVGVKGNSFDLLSILVAVIASLLIIFVEIKSIKTKKKHGFDTVPMWQTIVKLTVIMAILWFFMIKLATQLSHQ